MKKLLFLFALSLCSLAAWAQSPYDFYETSSGKTLYYKITSSTMPYTVEVTHPNSSGYQAYNGFSAPTGSLTIPSTVTYDNVTYTVTSIGYMAFYYCSGLTSVTIPNSVTSIGDYAFSGCSGLTSVTIPNSVTSIGYMVFYYCSGLTSVTIPNSVTSIGYSAFDNCSGLTSVIIPNSVTSIGGSAFSRCSGLTSVTIPNSVTSIGGAAFSYCRSLTSVTIPNSVTSIEYSAFSDCSGLTSVTIPNSVTSIGDRAFSYCRGLTSITIPNSVTSIGDWAFSYCSGLTSITIPNSVTSIGEYAFDGCSGLTSVTIPNSVTSIGEYAFYGCRSLTSVTIPNSVTSIGHHAFDGCRSLTSVTIPNSVTSIGHHAFDGCSGLTTMIVENGNTHYDSRSNCNAIIETSTNKLMFGCNNSTIPNSVTSIGDSAFFNCTGLTSVTIPNSVTSIGSSAFYGCSGLTSVTIGNSVTSIGGDAFYDCSSLTNVDYTGTIEGWCGISFSNYYANPSACYVHTLSFNGTPMGSTLTIPNSVTAIGQYAFDNCPLTSVTIPNSVTSIGVHAFSGCSNLTNVNYIGTIEGWCGISFGNVYANPTYYAHTLSFNGTPMGSTLTIPNSVTSIGSYAFYGFSSLTSVTIPNSVISIGTEAFKNCSGLTSVTIPNFVTSIGTDAFRNCSGLTSVTIGNSVTWIGTTAFRDCSNLKTVYNLSNLSITKGTGLNGQVARYADRVVNCTEHSGEGDNIIYKIPASYSFVDVEDDVETHIPQSSIPTNFIYYDNSAKDGGSWKAKNIVLTDGQDAFEAPETFTAETATYTREFTNSNRNTLYLPFTAAIPANFEVYDFTSFANNTISFTKREDSIYAYTPYLVGYDLSKDGNTTTCTITKTDVVFPKSESANYHPVTRNGMTFQGVLERTEMTSTNNYGYSNGFFVQSGGHAHVNPFRSYFTYTAPAGAPQSLPPTLNVEVGYGDPVGIDAVETPDQEYDGRYGKDVYDMLGRLVRKNADNLQGLPRGIYIWKGKKVMNYDF